MLRREVLASILALAAGPLRAQGAGGSDLAAEPGLQLGTARPFAMGDVSRLARALADQPHIPPMPIPDAWTEISFDQYRKIWFDHRNALWEASGAEPFRIDVFAPGLYFPNPIAIDIVEGDAARPLLFDMAVFDTTDQFPDLPIDDSLGYSGFRLRAELDRPGIFTEFAVFQGASYFRGIGAGQIYGLSARGLALDTAEPSGEEFPEFRHYWIERPEPGADHLVVHALLDSPSVTGAYTFTLYPGAELRMGVEAEVFARRRVRHMGLGALTSMFQFDETNRHDFSDFRTAVHDSDGLLIRNGAGESLWRPLSNPNTLQISAFQDENPIGFGLMQRAQEFEDFADLEALYHRRPSLWIAPREGWGRGSVTLVEIPTDDEIYDNIVAYWRPADALEPGESRAFSYDMTWTGRHDFGQGLQVLNTRAGQARSTGIIFAVDFAPGDGLPDDLSELMTFVRTTAGEVSQGILQRNPETGGARFNFTFWPGEAQLAEMRAQLRAADGAPLSEVWLYRWTA
ncbi:MAG: glucan biosynthesis protein G [Pseudomonadota bacterium]